MENLNTADFPLAVEFNAASAPNAVVLLNPGARFKVDPPKAVSSVPDDPVAGTNQSLDPSWPLRNSVPDPKFEMYCFGVAGDAATAVPPLAVV
jgi:hypothetical protein